MTCEHALTISDSVPERPAVWPPVTMDVERARSQARVRRMTEYAEVVALGWSREHICWYLSVSERTLERYDKRLREGESPFPTEYEEFMWSVGRHGAKLHFPLLRATLLGYRAVARRDHGPCWFPVEYRPRHVNDREPWLGCCADLEDQPVRFHSNQCRAVARHLLGDAQNRMHIDTVATALVG